MMYNEETVKNIINEHNNNIEDFIKSIPSQLGKTEKELTMEDWFKAQALIKAEDFHKKAMAILKELRYDGYDIKIDMQSDKLLYHGLQ